MGGLAELAQLVVTHAHAPGEPHDLSAPAIPIGGERRELALSLGESLGSGEHGPLPFDLAGVRLVETPQLLVAPLSSKSRARTL